MSLISQISVFFERLGYLFRTPSFFLTNARSESWLPSLYMVLIAFFIFGSITALFSSLKIAFQHSVPQAIVVLFLSLFFLILSAVGFVASILFFTILLFVCLRFVRVSAPMSEVFKALNYSSVIWFVYLFIPGLLGVFFGRTIVASSFTLFLLLAFLGIGVFHSLFLLVRAISLYCSLSEVRSFFGVIFIPGLLIFLLTLLLSLLVRLL
jgi:hypothetical protein